MLLRYNLHLDCSTIQYLIYRPARLNCLLSETMKILVAEDDTPLRKSIARSLEKHGHTVTQVENGDIAQYMALLSNYDMVISDVNMPEVDGITMTKFVKTKTDTPLLLISGWDQNEVKERAKESGAEGFLQKPFDEQDLMDAVTAILKKSRK